MPSITINAGMAGWYGHVTVLEHDTDDDLLDAARRLHGMLHTLSEELPRRAPRDPNAPPKTRQRAPRRASAKPERAASGNAAALAERVILARLDGGATTRAELISGLNGTTTGAEVLDDLVRVGDLVCVDGRYMRS